MEQGPRKSVAALNNLEKIGSEAIRSAEMEAVAYISGWGITNAAFWEPAIAFAQKLGICLKSYVDHSCPKEFINGDGIEKDGDEEYRHFCCR